VNNNPCNRGVMVNGTGTDVASPVIDSAISFERPGMGLAHNLLEILATARALVNLVSRNYDPRTLDNNQTNRCELDVLRALIGSAGGRAFPWVEGLPSLVLK